MGAILSSLPRTVIAAFVLALVVFIVITHGEVSQGTLLAAVRWLHVASGVMWIGLLWYFNFVQIPSMPKIPAEQKPAVSKVIAPAALFWFRWAAMATIILGLILAALNGTEYLTDAVSLGFSTGHVSVIGIGMWLGTIMWFNVWFVIWPNQKKALGITPVDADATAKAARIGMLFSRTNTLLSVAMLMCMIGQSHPF
ncbi:MAG: hypothetical protein EPO08_19250 [Rhodospirillaceae bacterium]|nr:MAG: hypothetical protein EPO08_19250 [Rhodospirillaceae bacterium]